jgi:glycosyltransferase involved in cell wall biosynthesis
VVVCNGCHDDTADVARRYKGVKVIETPVGSKVNALNLGDAAVSGFPRIYLDADVVITPETVALLASALDTGAALAAAPRPTNLFLPGTAWSVKAYHRFWRSLAYIEEGMIAAGAYALGREGRARFGAFPDIIADDGYVRLLFAPHERAQVEGAVSHVWEPMTLEELVKVRTRSRLGVMQLRNRYPDLFATEAKAKNYGAALLKVLRTPSLYVPAIPYAYVVITSWLRARRRMAEAAPFVWERDDSSRRVKIPK